MRAGSENWKILHLKKCSKVRESKFPLSPHENNKFSVFIWFCGLFSTKTIKFTSLVCFGLCFFIAHKCCHGWVICRQHLILHHLYHDRLKVGSWPNQIIEHNANWKILHKAAHTLFSTLQFKWITYQKTGSKFKLKSKSVYIQLQNLI